MAKSDAVWGIDIGNSSLKALRCRPAERDIQIVADAFDFIEYPKILTQPGAEPAELIAEAFDQFLSRNTLRGDRVAISVPGQSGLARFIKLPPIETKRIPDIVRYEAKQQIPFALEDVIWDFQRLGGGMIEEGFALDTEIGLFAMKRDQVHRALEPFHDKGIEVDFIQLTPLALFNYLKFDQLYDLPPSDEFDPLDPPPSFVVLSMGTDATDLVVTNGYRVWQRSIPLGGNHFTKALTKELKLTFAKAEHLKRNATAAEDPKAVFQAMRPVFSDLVTEVQRSIAYFTSLDKSAKVENIFALGNAMKLPGLRRYLEQSLGQKVARVDEYRGLAGPEVIEAAAFKKNRLCFGVCYGLALQGLGKGGIHTNLLPSDIVTDRLVREKKPWAVAAAAVLLLGCTISFVSFSRALGTVDEKDFGPVEQRLQQVKQTADGFQSKFASAQGEFDQIDEIGRNLVSNIEDRTLWLELFKVINECLPTETAKEPLEDISQRRELHITNIECQRLDDLAVWFNWIQQNGWHKSGSGQAAAGESGADAAASADGATADAAASEGAAIGESLTGKEGWVVQLTGHHFRNPPRADERMGNRYVQETLVKNLGSATMKILLPVGDTAVGEKEERELVTPRDLGISHPVLVDPQRIRVVSVTNPNVESREGGGTGYPGGGMGYEEEAGGYADTMGSGAGMAMGSGMGTMGTGMGAGGRPKSGEDEPEEPREITLRRLDFVVQFAWKPITPSQRRKQKQNKRQRQRMRRQVMRRQVTRRQSEDGGA